MATSGNSHRRSNNSDTTSTPDRRQDRSQVQQILHEVGLNPSDYIFSPLPEDSSSEEQISNYPSAFSNYSPREQQPNNQNLLKPQTKSLITSGRPLSSVQNPPPQPPPPSQPPIDQLSSPFHRDQGPPPPPPPGPQNPPSQTGPPLPSFLFNRTTPETQNTTSQAMNQHSFSPRRSPPLPPHLTSHHIDSTLSAEHYLRKINSHETPPVKVVKPNTQNIVYRKEIRIRYLQPPTPPPPAPIIIREKHDAPIPPPSPLLIRERKPEARTPPPLTIRERPPSPPAPLEPCVIEKHLPPLPPQPQQIIIERLPTPPPKPRTVIFEKWLPYKKVKRPVLLQKAPPLEPVKATRNVIIEYEPLKAFTVRRVIEEGVFRVDPHEYSSYNAQPHTTHGDVRIVERIEDLPPPSEKLMRVLRDYNQHGSSPLSGYDHQYHSQTPHRSEHIPSSIQHLLADARPVSNIDHLTNISRASSTANYRQERVHSTGYDSSNPSPTIVPIQRSHSKHSHPYSQRYTSGDSPTRSHIDGIY